MKRDMTPKANAHAPGVDMRSDSMTSESQPAESRGWLPWLLILLAGLLAFGGCLRADFYMDDFSFILNSNGDGPVVRIFQVPFGSFQTGAAGLDSTGVRIFQLIPTGLFMLTERLVPDVAEASWLYHLWNLLLHLGTACFAYSAGREILALAGLLRDDQTRARAALIGAVLFACHPLCSEPVHYAKCLNSITVAMFAFMAVAGAARWLRCGGLRAFWIAAGGLLGATFSYFPGLALTVLWLGILVLFRMRSLRSDGDGEKTFRWKSGGGLVIVIAVGITAAVLAWVYSPYAMRQWSTWRSYYPAHTLTQGRLLWDYLLMMAVPLGLCSDHYVPWSKPWEDTAAIVRLAVVAVIVFGGVFLICFRRAGALRGVALLLLLALTPLALRFAYVNHELFVEYRAYPAVPWIMLLVGAGLVKAGARFPRLPVAATGTVAVLWIVLSEQRSVMWTSRERLALDVVKQFPFNTRAMTQLQAIANDAGNPEEVLRLHSRILNARKAMADYPITHPGRFYDATRMDGSTILSCQWVIYAIAALKGSAEAIGWADTTIAELKALWPEKFRGENVSGDTPAAWPVLEARKTVSEHRAEIDAANAARKAAGATNL